MSKYRVVWAQDIEANSSREAAIKALLMIIGNDRLETHLEVHPPITRNVVVFPIDELFKDPELAEPSETRNLPDVVIEINGGSLSEVYSDIPLRAVLIDWDNIQQGDTPGEVSVAPLGAMDDHTRQAWEYTQQ